MNGGDDDDNDDNGDDDDDGDEDDDDDDDEVIHALFAILWGPPDSTNAFQQLCTTRLPPMRRSIHYLRYSGTPQIRGVDSNNYLQHFRLQ